MIILSSHRDCEQHKLNCLLIQTMGGFNSVCEVSNNTFDDVKFPYSTSKEKQYCVLCLQRDADNNSGLFIMV